MKPHETAHLSRYYQQKEVSYGRSSPGESQEVRILSGKKQAVIEQLWLTYYNDTLYAKGLITEEQRNRMRVQIKNRAVAGRDR